MVANEARFLAWVFVARRTSESLCLKLYPKTIAPVSFQDNHERRCSRDYGCAKRGDLRSRPEQKDHARFDPAALATVSSFPSYRSSLSRQWARNLGNHEACSLHKRMRKAHFGSVYRAIAGSLDDAQEILVSRVEDDALNGGLRMGR